MHAIAMFYWDLQQVVAGHHPTRTLLTHTGVALPDKVKVAALEKACPTCPSTR